MKAIDFGFLFVWQVMKLIPDDLQEDSATFVFILKKGKGKRTTSMRKQLKHGLTPFSLFISKVLNPRPPPVACQLGLFLEDLNGIKSHKQAMEKV